MPRKIITFETKGDFRKTETALKRMGKREIYDSLDESARMGVAALSLATPQDTGLTSSLWGYEIVIGQDYSTITWTNSNVVDGTPVAILLQYGHGTGTGGYVEGRDFINPVMTDVFDQISNDVWQVIQG